MRGGDWPFYNEVVAIRLNFVKGWAPDRDLARQNDKRQEEIESERET